MKFFKFLRFEFPAIESECIKCGVKIIDTRKRAMCTKCVQALIDKINAEEQQTKNAKDERKEQPKRKVDSGQDRDGI